MTNKECKQCGKHIHPPPSISFLSIRFPHVTLNSSLDRSVPRCKHCDMVRAEQRAIAAILAPPTFENPIEKYEVGVKQINDLLASFEYDQEVQTALKAVVLSMRCKWAGLKTAREDATREAWRPYWAIWGVVEGQEGL